MFFSSVAHVLPLSNGGAIRWMACAGACCLVLNGSDDAVDWEKCYLLMDLYLLLLPSAGCVSLKKGATHSKKVITIVVCKELFFCATLHFIPLCVGGDICWTSLHSMLLLSTVLFLKKNIALLFATVWWRCLFLMALYLFCYSVQAAFFPKKLKKQQKHCVIAIVHGSCFFVQQPVFFPAVCWKCFLLNSLYSMLSSCISYRENKKTK